jgi:flagellin-like protein
MRWRTRGSRGLAEIVGTLMLVVIVVAAVTAFSFFVASYQKQLQAQETLSHDRALEGIKVIGVTEVTCAQFVGGCSSNGSPNDSFASISFRVASLDVNTIAVTGLFLDGMGIVDYTATPSTGGAISPCYNSSAHHPGNRTSGLVPCAPLRLGSYSTVTFTFNLDENTTDSAFAFAGSEVLLPTSALSLQVLTQLTNLFTASFAPPDAVISVFYVSNAGSSVPVFDGLSSYQPPTANNASILWYNWTISNASCPIPSTGAEFECGNLSMGPHTVVLTVTDTDGLSGTTQLTYTQP